MLIRKGEFESTLEDGAGELIAVCLKHQYNIMLVQVDPSHIIEHYEQNKRRGNYPLSGMPIHFAVKEVCAKRTEFMFYPIADDDYEVEITYYPYAKRG